MLNRILALFLLTLLLVPCAFADGTQPRNTMGFTIYNQDMYGADDPGNWELAGYAGRTLETSGCFMFTYAHAQQFLTGEVTDDGLIRALLTVCLDPNGHYDHVKCPHMPITGSAFHPFNRFEGFPMAEDELPVKTPDGLITRRGLDDFFARGKRVLCLHGGGHHVLAVEMKEFGGVDYVHIVDSHWGSIQDKERKAYYYDQPDGTMLSVTVDPDYYGYGCDYWMMADDVANFFKATYAWKLSATYTFAD